VGEVVRSKVGERVGPEVGSFDGSMEEKLVGVKVGENEGSCDGDSVSLETTKLGENADIWTLSTTVDEGNTEALPRAAAMVINVCPNKESVPAAAEATEFAKVAYNDAAILMSFECNGTLVVVSIAYSIKGIADCNRRLRSSLQLLKITSDREISIISAITLATKFCDIGSSINAEQLMVIPDM